jgi:hypothetical protein
VPPCVNRRWKLAPTIQIWKNFSISIARRCDGKRKNPGIHKENQGFCKRGRRGSNPQPPDRQLDSKNFKKHQNCWQIRLFSPVRKNSLHSMLHSKLDAPELEWFFRPRANCCELPIKVGSILCWSSYLPVSSWDRGGQKCSLNQNASPSCDQVSVCNESKRWSD